MSNPPLVVNPVVIEGWRLPFDVMSGIMAMSTRRSTISTLMKTSHTLYTEGPKHLLCDGVQLNGSIDIVRFADFMLTGDPSRFAHLRKLVLNIRFFVTVNSSDVQARFIDLLAHPCLSLETLILHQTDVFMGRRAPPSLREAFCKLKTIKRLVALGVRGDSASIIQSLPSPLESISIGVDLGQPFDILPTLQPFSDTLHTLLINSKPSSPARSLFENSQPPSFPHISTFGVVWDDSVPELLASPVFARTFPAISHLKLVPPEHPVVMPLWQSRVFGYGEPQVGSLARQLSVAPQIQTSQHQTRLLSSLRGLSECSGELSSVSMLSLQCTLSSLRLWKPILIGDLPALGAALEEIRPRRLCLTTLVDHVADVFTTFSTLQTQAPPRIDLDILGSWGPESAFSEKVLKKIRSSLEPLFKQPPPTGLAELSLLFVTSDGLGPSGQPESLTQKHFVEGGGIFAAFTRWASGSRLTLTWRSSVDVDEEERRWPYLGQIGDDDDDSDSDYGYDYANDYENESDEIRHFCGDDDEYDSDQWRRWNDDD